MKIVGGGDDSKSVSGRECSLQNFAESALENQSRFAYSDSASRKMPPSLPCPEQGAVHEPSVAAP